MAKEQNKKTTVGLTDEEIIEGLRNRDPQITRDYFYGVCRIAYHIYNKHYGLEWKWDSTSTALPMSITFP